MNPIYFADEPYWAKNTVFSSKVMRFIKSHDADNQQYILYNHKTPNWLGWF